MSEWRDVTLGDMLTLQRGFDITKKQQRPGAIPVVSSSGIGSHHDEARAPAPGVVVGRKGSLGTVFYVNEPFWPHDTTLWVKDFKGNDPYFCHLLLRTLPLAELDAGSSNPTLNRNHIHPMPVRLPDVATQRRIARVLSAFDEFIEINERRIETLERLTQSVFEERFVRCRGSRPGRWCEGTLGDVAHVNASTLRKDHLPDPLRYVDVSSVGVRRINNLRAVPATDAPSRARRVVRDGDVIWSMVRPNRRSHALLCDPGDDVVVSTAFAVLTPTRVPSSFLYEFTSRQEFASYLESRATGAAYPAVRPSDVDGAPLVIPPKELLSEFDALAGPALRLASQLEHENLRLAHTRDLLLPRLVSGRLDISGIDLGGLLPDEGAA